MKYLFKALGLMTAGAILYSVGVWMGYRYKFSKIEASVPEIYPGIFGPMSSTSYNLYRPKVGRA